MYRQILAITVLALVGGIAVNPIPILADVNVPPSERMTPHERLTNALRDVTSDDESTRQRALEYLGAVKTPIPQVPAAVLAGARKHLKSQLSNEPSNEIFDGRPPGTENDLSVSGLDAVTAKVAQDFRRWQGQMFSGRGESRAPSHRVIAAGYVAFSVSDKGEQSYVLYDMTLKELQRRGDAPAQGFRLSDIGILRAFESIIRRDERNKPMKVARLRWEVLPAPISDGRGGIAGLNFMHVVSDIQLLSPGTNEWSPWLMSGTRSYFEVGARSGDLAIPALTDLVSDPTVGENDAESVILLQLTRQTVDRLDVNSRKKFVARLKLQVPGQDPSVRDRRKLWAEQLQSVIDSEQPAKPRRR